MSLNLTFKMNETLDLFWSPVPKELRDKTTPMIPIGKITVCEANGGGNRVVLCIETCEDIQALRRKVTESRELIPYGESETPKEGDDCLTTLLLNELTKPPGEGMLPLKSTTFLRTIAFLQAGDMLERLYPGTEIPPQPIEPYRGNWPSLEAKEEAFRAAFAGPEGEALAMKLASDYGLQTNQFWKDVELSQQEARDEVEGEGDV